MNSIKLSKEEYRRHLVDDNNMQFFEAELVINYLSSKQTWGRKQ